MINVEMLEFKMWKKLLTAQDKEDIITFYILIDLKNDEKRPKHLTKDYNYIMVMRVGRGSNFGARWQ